MNELVYINSVEKVKTAHIWEEQIRHLNKISEFCIDTDRLTYANSHGDYHIGQFIVKNCDITVVDSACRFPICLDVVTSYVFACPSCAEGVIDAEGLKNYIQRYSKSFPISKYDVKTMPYVLYFWHCVCNYRPDELETIAESYKPIAKLINNLLNWLYIHVDELSNELAGKFEQD